MKINLNITQDLSCSSSKFQVMIYILGRTNFIKNIPHQLDELFVQEEKKRNIDIELRMIKWGKFCIKELVGSDHQLLSSVWRTGRHWNKIMRRNIWLLVWVRTEDPDYCRTLEPLWLQWDDNDSSGVISPASRDQTGSLVICLKTISNPGGSHSTSVSVISVLSEQKKQYLVEINFPPPQGRLINTENISSIILVLSWQRTIHWPCLINVCFIVILWTGYNIIILYIAFYLRFIDQRSNQK